mgnify:CR=1 FL=1
MVSGARVHQSQMDNDVAPIIMEAKVWQEAISGE